MDLNRNKIDDFEELKMAAEELKKNSDGYFKRIITWLKDKKNLTIVILSVLLIACLVWIMKVEQNPELKKTINENIDKVKDVKVIVDDSHTVTYDLTKMTKHKVVETKSSKSGKEIFGVWYKIETPEDKTTNSVYLTIYENIDSLDKNKEAFSAYVEEQSKEAVKLSK